MFRRAGVGADLGRKGGGGQGERFTSTAKTSTHGSADLGLLKDSGGAREPLQPQARRRLRSACRWRAGSCVATAACGRSRLAPRPTPLRRHSMRYTAVPMGTTPNGIRKEQGPLGGRKDRRSTAVPTSPVGWVVGWTRVRVWEGGGGSGIQEPLSLPDQAERWLLPPGNVVVVYGTITGDAPVRAHAVISVAVPFACMPPPPRVPASALATDSANRTRCFLCPKVCAPAVDDADVCSLQPTVSSPTCDGDTVITAVDTYRRSCPRARDYARWRARGHACGRRYR